MTFVQRRFEVECLDGTRLMLVEKVVQRLVPPWDGGPGLRSSIEVYTKEDERRVFHNVESGFYELWRTPSEETIAADLSDRKMCRLIEAKRHWCEVIDGTGRDLKWGPIDHYKGIVLVEGLSHRFQYEDIAGGHRCRIFADVEIPLIEFDLIDDDGLLELKGIISSKLARFFSDG